MGLETAEFISELVDTNPTATDKKRQGDDHLRLIKEVLQNTFPNADKAFYMPVFEAKTGDFSITAAHMNRTFTVSTASAEVTATLPSLTADDDGWCCHFIKTNTGTNALFIAPASGTLQSGEVTGLTKCRRVIPGHRCTAMWDGSAWYVTRVPSVPVGTCLEYHGTDLPVGYEWPNGQTLSSASTKYLEFYAKNGNSGVVLDKRGRVAACQDDIGGTSANRLTGLSGGVDGDTFGAVGGDEKHELTEAQNGEHGHAIIDNGHNHDQYDFAGIIGAVGTTPNANTGYVNSNTNDDTSSDETGISIVNSGEGAAHNNVQPTIVVNFILVVE